jgi:hypothetical protein
VTAARLRRRGAVLTLALALAPVAVPTVATAASECTTESGVLVVVDFGDGRVGSGCAPGDPASGLDAAAQAGFVLSYNTAGMVCQVEGHPGQCPPSPPFDAYWSFWHGVPAGGWRYATVGAGQHDPAPGSVLGWRFGGGGQVAPAHPGTAPAPPPPPPAPSPTPRPEPAPSPHASPAPTPRPLPPTSAPQGPDPARGRTGSPGPGTSGPATAASGTPGQRGAPTSVADGPRADPSPEAGRDRGAREDEDTAADDAAATASSPATVPGAGTDDDPTTAGPAGGGASETSSSAAATRMSEVEPAGPPAGLILAGSLAVTGAGLALWRGWWRRRA